MKLKPLSAIVLLAAQSSIWAATAPYSNDFSGTGTNTAFPAADSNYTVSGGKYAFAFSSTMWTAATASIPITNMGTQSFTMKTDFNISSMGTTNGNASTIGIGAFGADTTFTGAAAASSYYLADWTVAATPSPSGTLRIIAVGDTTGVTTTSVTIDDNALATLAAQLNTNYTFKLVGTYTGSTLNMTFGLYNSAGTQIGTSATLADTSRLTGTNFGYRNRIGIGGSSFNAAFDNFSVTVPEPASLALLSVASFATLRRRSRRI